MIPSKTRTPYNYVFLSLRRPSLQVPWGMTLTLLEGPEPRFLTVGAAGQALAHHVFSLWACVSPLDPSPFWNVAVDVPALAKFLIAQPSVSTSLAVIPGDCILSINFKPIARFANMKEVVREMKSVTMVHLIMLRNPVPTNETVVAKVSNQLKPSVEKPVAQNRNVVRSLANEFSPKPNKLEQSKSTNVKLTSDQKEQPAPRPSLPQRPALDTSRSPRPVTIFRNPAFQDSTGENIQFCDDSLEQDPDEGKRASLFLSNITSSNFDEWLSTRKQQWRSRYKVYKIREEFVEDESAHWRREDCRQVPQDFWTSQGFTSFHHWLSTSTLKWRQTYSWNRRKRKRIEQDCDEIVHLSPDTFSQWLRVRKNQWRVQRRKRQRQRVGIEPETAISPDSLCSGLEKFCGQSGCVRNLYSQSNDEIVLIDAFLEEQEQEQKALKERPPLDIARFLDPSAGCPDDVVSHCMTFLEPREHGKLLSIDTSIRKNMIQRESVWRLLCPSSWKLPRRPRKPWHELYLTRLRIEYEKSQKKCDDLLARAANVLAKGDQLSTIEKLVRQGERDFAFHVNYSSGVVCERNSLVNLAVIHKRHKVVKWLVEVKRVDIESYDRGSFTPLLNAAWSGDRYLVRFLLQNGANRQHVGTSHYTRPLASPDFKGHNAADWAKKRGHSDIARLIRLGL